MLNAASADSALSSLSWLSSALAFQINCESRVTTVLFMNEEIVAVKLGFGRLMC